MSGLELIRKLDATGLARIVVNGRYYGVPATVINEIDRLRAELENAESALIRSGFRKSCDIPACNCGDQWGHGGHASKRLSEIDEALPYENGKTILQRVTGLVVEADRLRAENEALKRDANAMRDFADLWYFVMDEAPLQFEKIVAEYSPASWMQEAAKLRAAMREQK